MQGTMRRVLPVIMFLAGVASLPQYNHGYRRALFVPMVQYSSQAPQTQQVPFVPRTANYAQAADISRIAGLQQLIVPRTTNYQQVIAVSRGPQEHQTTAAPRVQQVSQPSDDYQYNVKEVAALKGAYQAAFAAMASRKASQTGIHWQTGSPSVYQQNLLSYQPSKDLYHRNAALQVQPRPILLRPVESTRPLQVRPAYIHQQPNIAQQPNQYNSNGASQTSAQNDHENVLVILPNGFLADTQEVQDAKKAHLAEVAKAIAVASRAEAREAQQMAARGPGAQQRRVAVEYRPEELNDSYYNVAQPVPKYVKFYRNS